MEFLRRHWTQIRTHLDGLSISQRMAIGLALLLGIMLVVIVVGYASQPQMVPISAFANARSEEVLVRLRAAGIEATQEAGQILVPRDDEERALVLLVQDDLLSADVSEAFDELLARQSPWQTNQQNAQAYLLAKQRVLGQIIGKMAGVQRGDVILSMPQSAGFAQTHQRPSASVTVWMRGGNAVSDRMVESVARLVAGSVAELRPQDVSITDANHGRTRTIRDEDDVLPLEALELVRHLESYHREKIGTVLGYIPGVIVAVNVQIDPITRDQAVEYTYPDSEPLVREQIEERNTRNIQNDGEPGPRSNTGLSIAGSGPAGSEEQYTRTSTEFGVKPLLSQRNTTRAGHQVRQINVTINVPRRYFVQLHRAMSGEEESPSDEALQALMDQHLKRIEAQVEPLISAEAQGVVRAHMVPDDTLLPPMHPGTAPGGGMGGILASDWFTPVTIGLLALLSLGLMLGMVRKATQKEAMPSLEELAGIPPMLGGDDELLGEVEESESAMVGVEMEEGDLHSRRIAEQISDMIKSNPQEASQILGRWVRKQD